MAFGLHFFQFPWPVSFVLALKIFNHNNVSRLSLTVTSHDMNCKINGLIYKSGLRIFHLNLISMVLISMFSMEHKYAMEIIEHQGN